MAETKPADPGDPGRAREDQGDAAAITRTAKTIAEDIAKATGRRKRGLRTWIVSLHGRQIARVRFIADANADRVRRLLVQHEDYHEDIVVEPDDPQRLT